jgi:hypothetical protein
MVNNKSEFLKVSAFWEDELKLIWLENHQKDLDPKQTCEYHQTGWRDEYS